MHPTEREERNRNDLIDKALSTATGDRCLKCSHRTSDHRDDDCATCATCKSDADEAAFEGQQDGLREEYGRTDARMSIYH